MNLDLILVIVFYLILYSLFVIYRSRFDVQNKFFILYKTRLGLKLMDKLSVHKRLLNFFGFISVVLGFIGMAFIFYILIKGSYSLLFVPETAPVLSPVLPGIAIKGLPVLSFWHWIIAILIIATIHEFFHGVYARRFMVRIKSSGFAFLGPLLAAFVEPDENQLKKKKTYPQLQVLSSGPFSNILFAGLILLLMVLVVNPVSDAITEEKGLVIAKINETMPVGKTMLREGMVIEKIDDVDIFNKNDFIKAIDRHRPGDSVFVHANSSFYEVRLGANPINKSKAMIGLFVSPVSVGLKDNVRERYFDFYFIYSWLVELLFWLFVISLGVGLFNLLPLGPVDGGRMFFIAMIGLFKDEKKARKIYLFITWLCLLLIFINLLPYIAQFFKWIVSLII